MVVDAAELASPSQAAVNTAISTQLISFDRDFSGGAHTNGAFFGGASITLAVASYAGNTTADSRLLQQIRHTLTPGNEPTSNGGYPAQHERHVTGMFVIVKNTPRIWNQLSTAEKARMDLIMKATFVADAFTTSDNNPFVKADGQEYALDADSNINRDWNPNYREGMIGGVLTGMSYFGGPSPAQAILANYSHPAFLAELSAANMPNIYETFNWKAANPSSKAPSGSTIESALDAYKYKGSALVDYMKIYEALVSDTYARNVNAGLNNGAGTSGGAGKIVSGADTLPNKGALGMLKEFDANDANGARSSFLYAFDGYRPHMTNQIALIVGGYWQKGSTIANNAVARMNIGNTDLWYKAEKGYLGYAKGKAQNLVNYSLTGSSRGFVYNRSLWDDVLRPYHELPGTGEPPPDPPDPPAFAAGARIETSVLANIRSGPSNTATLVGTTPDGSLGTVLAGPTTANGIEWWQVYFDSGVTGWVSENDFDAAPTSEYLATTTGAWQNRSIAAQTGNFSISFNMRPSAAGIDAVTGLSTSGASAFSAVAVALRFAPSGVFDARNGGAYQAANVLTYQAGVTYRVAVTVNVPARTYSATVTPPGGSPVTIASNYAFRSEQASANSLANLAVFAQTGSHTTSGISFQSVNTPPSAPTGLRVVSN